MVVGRDLDWIKTEDAGCDGGLEERKGFWSGWLGLIEGEAKAILEGDYGRSRADRGVVGEKRERGFSIYRGRGLWKCPPRGDESSVQMAFRGCWRAVEG